MPKLVKAEACESKSEMTCLSRSPQQQYEGQEDSAATSTCTTTGIKAVPEETTITTRCSTTCSMPFVEEEKRHDNNHLDRIQQAEEALFRFFCMPQSQKPQTKHDQTFVHHNFGLPSATPRYSKSTHKKLQLDSSKNRNDNTKPKIAPEESHIGDHRSSTRRVAKNEVLGGNKSPTLPPPPRTWPQRPVFIRATPGSSTQILGIRPAIQNDFFDVEHHHNYGAIPINTGQEKGPQECFVVDFMSRHFVGTLLVRVNGVPSLHNDHDHGEEYNNHHQETSSSPSGRNNPKAVGYFHGRQRTFQGVIKGRFHAPLKLDQCVTGQVFRRPAGSLPAHWIIKTFEALVQRLAPHNELHMEGQRPRSLAPLATTAQTIVVQPAGRVMDCPPNDDDGLVLHDGHFFYDSVYQEGYSIEEMKEELQEPHPSDPCSLIYHAIQQQQQNDSFLVTDSKANNNKEQLTAPPPHHNDHRKCRKTFFNQSYTNKATKNLQFTTDKEYTFEFYDHLIVFEGQELCLDLNLPFLHHIKVAPITDGQPIQLMSAVRRQSQGQGETDQNIEYLWNFEVWHESLYPLAKKATP